MDVKEVAKDAQEEPEGHHRKLQTTLLSSVPKKRNTAGLMEPATTRRPTASAARPAIKKRPLLTTSRAVPRLSALPDIPSELC